eukprot:12336-Heterococcus_DN1.PRE.1
MKQLMRFTRALSVRSHVDAAAPVEVLSGLNADKQSAVDREVVNRRQVMQQVRQLRPITDVQYEHKGLHCYLWEGVCVIEAFLTAECTATTTLHYDE